MLVELAREETVALDRPANGSGGFQTFIKRLQGQVNHGTGTIKLTDDAVDEIQHYVSDYKQGGFQDRLDRKK